MSRSVLISKNKQKWKFYFMLFYFSKNITIRTSSSPYDLHYIPSLLQSIALLEIFSLFIIIFLV